MPNSIHPEIIEFAELKLHGIKIATSHETAFQDCPELWLRFGELQIMENTESYGISVMNEQIEPGTNKFSYWAAVPDSNLPAGQKDAGNTEAITLPGGKYARCAVRGLAKLGEVYMFLYSAQWLPDDSELAVDFSKPCFELYPADWNEDSVFHVFAPLAKKP